MSKKSNKNKIEGLLKALEKSDCPIKFIDSLINDETIDWDSMIGHKLIDAIIANPNTTLKNLLTIFSAWNSPILSSIESEELCLKYRKLIMKNSKWDKDEIIAILSEDIQNVEDGDELIFIVGSITDADGLDSETAKNIYVGLSKKVKSKYCLCEWARIVMESGDIYVAETLLNQAIKITDNPEDWNTIFDAVEEYEELKMIVLKNSACPSAFICSIVEGDNMKLKLSVLENPCCTKDMLIQLSEDKENYSSSYIRKAVALHKNTSIVTINKLLKDEYRWVRESAASNSILDISEIEKTIKTGDRYVLKGLLVNKNSNKSIHDTINKMLEDEEKFPIEFDTYKIKNGFRVGIVEDIGGSVSIDDVVQAIVSGEEEWSSYIHMEFYIYEDSWHSYGPTNLVDSVVYPDKSIGTYSESLIQQTNNETINIEIGGESEGNECFFQTASSHEKGDWEYGEFHLEYEFKPEFIRVIYEDETQTPGVISYYEYDNPKEKNIKEIEGELLESSTSGTDIMLYVNTKDGIEICDCFSDIQLEMEEESLNFKDKEVVLKFLKKKYNI